jgi:hypothetical protein
VEVPSVYSKPLGAAIRNGSGSVRWQICVRPSRIQRHKEGAQLGDGKPPVSNSKDIDATKHGLGWYIARYRDERMLHHFGGFSSLSALISYLPDQAIGVAVFSNDSTVGLLLVDAIANYVYDRAGGYPGARQRFDAALDGAARGIVASPIR